MFPVTINEMKKLNKSTTSDLRNDSKISKKKKLN